MKLRKRKPCLKKFQRGCNIWMCKQVLTFTSFCLHQLLLKFCKKWIVNLFFKWNVNGANFFFESFPLFYLQRSMSRWQGAGGNNSSFSNFKFAVDFVGHEFLETLNLLTWKWFRIRRIKTIFFQMIRKLDLNTWCLSRISFLIHFQKLIF
jgi:hypothetical protein